MGALVVLSGLAFTAVAALFTIAIVGILVKTAVRLILLPLLLIKWLIAGIVMLVVGPILFVVGALAFLSVGLVLAVPLLPLFAVAAIVWVIVRSNRRPAVA